MYRLEATRQRQEQLARERLAAPLSQRRHKGTTQEDDSNDQEVAVPEDDDVIKWQEAVLKEIELKHQSERNVLLTVTSHINIRIMILIYYVSTPESHR